MDNDNQVIEEAVIKELEAWSKLETILKDNTRDNASEFLNVLKVFKPLGIEATAGSNGLEFKINSRKFKEFVAGDLLEAQRPATNNSWIDSYNA